MQAVIPASREADVTGALLAAHTRLPLEQDDEAIDINELEPPPFDLDELGIEEDEEDNNTSTARFARHAHKRSHRVRRVANSVDPVECSEYHMNPVWHGCL